ncbi:predicted protein [Botrytis cinerea T4]|uniref:Uncharacterized protein n=1 Tax=Botryotinia fuckeliana (strain T4) TaxID=999810 RepID=G2YNB4_BOTF4|nr:predicted protein [Botrytis cinerea T4]
MARSLCKPSLSDASREVSLQPLSHDTGSGDDERRFWDHRPLSEPDTDLRDINEPGTLNVTTYGYTGTCFPGSQMRLRTVQMQDRDAEESDLENPLIFCGRGRHIAISFALDGVTYSILVRLLIPIPVYDSVIDP